MNVVWRPDQGVVRLRCYDHASPNQALHRFWTCSAGKLCRAAVYAHCHTISSPNPHDDADRHAYVYTDAIAHLDFNSNSDLDVHPLADSHARPVCQSHHS